MDRTLIPEVCQREDSALVVRARALVVDGHEAVALEVGNRNNGLVNRDLSVVDAKAVAVGVRVGEEARLQDRVARWLKVGDGMGGRESNLGCVSLRPSLLAESKSEPTCSTSAK